VKGVDVLLRAFAKVKAKIPDAQLFLVGDGGEREAVGRLVADLHLSSSVSMAGRIPRQEVGRYLAPAWVQVVPSRWPEPFGLVAAEALMRGTAVIASASGGLAEIVDDGETGFLVPAGDAEVLAGALEVLLADRELAEQMGRSGRQVALARFSEAAFFDRFLELYDELRTEGGRGDAP
jgi:glycosyltransferase involved in cell wall biosynthesis